MAKLIITLCAYVEFPYIYLGEIELIMCEIEQDATEFKPRMLQNNQIIEF